MQRIRPRRGEARQERLVKRPLPRHLGPWLVAAVLSLLATSLQVAARLLRRGPGSDLPPPDSAPGQPRPSVGQPSPRRDEILLWLAAISTLATVIAAIVSIVSLFHG